MRISASFLAKARANAECLMTDRCVVTRPGVTTTDPDTGLTTTGKEKVYEGSCKVQTSGGLASEQTEGSAAQAMGAASLVWSLYIHFPFGTMLRNGDLVTVTNSANPELVDRRYRMISPQSEKSWATACRWNVKEDA
ncbi:DUF6093 family protein [Bifidobacterium pseudocatenulatum]|uniref:DUF6093 family protein n=1 Tax=Bifidobacterium pseudocatenulatum TaxID=28026 RepID=A0ABD4W9W3_BIFPS|nr:DUF6093 family protein [Bifidobacterium pseudocatenulatum]MDB6492433.1 DUF6093 family protein [Bifidobacterium pseudocatenulatum]MDB6493596.1 DUF6093 family protein [Bifidobacterium pseudocatenulatum]MDB6504777.1 DUF6093 family protein [Bifidobacterium pseudocatenulatum]